jgi:thioredoxin reductase (NADPH)
MKRKLLIIGAGPAGYTAAIYAARSALNPLVVSGPQPGGQLMITTDVENYPGFEKAIQGPWLMEQMHLQALHCGTDFLEETIVRLDLTQRPFRAFTETQKEIEAEAIIIATGAQAKWLGIESETKFRGFGVSACATCDGFFFKNQTVVVIGGGNTAVEEAIHLTHHAKEVIIVHRRDAFRAEKITQDRLMSNKKIRVIWNHVVEEILGEDKPLRVTGIRLCDVQTNTTQELSVDGVFIAIGHKPMSDLVKGQLECDSDGYIIAEKGSTKTSIPGVFAAGDVQDKIFRQAVTAAGQGCMAALEAANFL